MIFILPNGRPVRIGQDVLLSMLQRAISKHPYETGGCLCGWQDLDSIGYSVEEMIPAPPDSYEGAGIFIRGNLGLQEAMERQWDEGRCYLGEWHSHPGKPCDLSDQDREQMSEIAGMAGFPVLLFIIGGDLARHPDYRCYLCAEGGVQRLNEEATESSVGI